MSRNIVSILLSTIFLVFITAPSIIIMIDDSVDVSAFYTSTSSEEEENSTEKNKEVNVLDFVRKENETQVSSLKTNNNLGYSFKNYPKIHLNLISPPPDLRIF